jgi:hypothetical protein
MGPEKSGTLMASMDGGLHTIYANAVLRKLYTCGLNSMRMMPLRVTLPRQAPLESSCDRLCCREEHAAGGNNPDSAR